jgi:hypothetical protein
MTHRTSIYAENAARAYVFGLISKLRRDGDKRSHIELEHVFRDYELDLAAAFDRAVDHGKDCS